MSNEGRNYVKQYSPFTGSTFWVHYVFGDIANRQHNYEIFIGDKRLMDEWPFSKRVISRARAELVENGFLTVLDDKSGPGRPIRYRFEFPGQEDGGQIGNRLEEDGGQNGEQRWPKSTASPITNKKEQNTPSRRRPETALPDDFTLTSAMADWAEKEVPQVPLLREFNQFKDHALAHDRRCRDWVAAWRTWMRKADQIQRERTAPTSGPRARQEWEV